MPFNVIDQYGQGGCFLDEGEQPEVTDSHYVRKTGKPENQCGNIKEGQCEKDCLKQQGGVKNE